MVCFALVNYWVDLKSQIFYGILTTLVSGYYWGVQKLVALDMGLMLHTVTTVQSVPSH